MKTLWLLVLFSCLGLQAHGSVQAQRKEVWELIQVRAARYRIDPGFVYALVYVESRFDPKARRGDARGMMQLKPGSWSVVSDAPYQPGVWEPKANLEAGIDYLAYLRHLLLKKGVFSYPLLFAAFQYGYDFVAERDFDVRRIDSPADPVARRLQAGELAPLPPPE